MNTTKPGTGSAVLADAVRLRLLRRLADALAHELRNPLNSVVINLEVLRTRVRNGRTAEALERIAVLEEETRRLDRLLEHLLGFLRPERGEGEFAADDLLAEVTAAARAFARPGPMTFALRPVGADVALRAAREPLRFALLALCEGVLDAAPAEAAEIVLGGRSRADGVELELAAPAGCAGALERASASAAALLAGEPVELATNSDGRGCGARLLVPRAG